MAAPKYIVDILSHLKANKENLHQLVSEFKHDMASD